jgi:hypothetical protein
LRLRCSSASAVTVSPAIAREAGRHARHFGKPMQSSSREYDEHREDR